MLNTDSVFSGTATVLGLPKAPSSRVFHRSWGLKQYELSNHLGNVQVTVSDKKIGVVGSNNVDFTSYQAEIISATDYYPGGMMMPYINYGTLNLRYTYNNFESDKEIFTSSGYISWGDYGYDSRTIRRWTQDFYHPKYPSLSPYSAVSNNPLINKEIDGKDYAVYVNHSSGTIIIKATYYTVKGDINEKNSANNAILFWNSQSDKFRYKVGKGSKAKYYDIKFQLDVKEVDNPIRQANIDKTPDGALTEGQSKLIEDGSSNVYSLKDDSHPSFKKVEENGKVTQTNGVTIGGNLVYIQQSHSNSETGSHEVGHTLGFGHLIFTLMSEYSNVGRRNKINSTVIEVILYQAGIGSNKPHEDFTKDTGSGYLQPATATAPNEFENGKVVKKR